MGRAAVAITLSVSERRELDGLARRRKTAQGLARRARIVLAAADGLENKAIMEQVGADANTVGKWRRRFAEHRLDGLYDEPRSGAPRTIDDQRIAEIIGLTLEQTPPDGTHWSLRSMARASGYAPSTIHRIFETRVPDDLDVHLVMDNYATHKTPAVQRWLAGHPRWHVHFTPTGASWLNQVERFFALLTEKQIRRGVHRSTQELEQAIRNYIDTVNADPRPFRWTKSADDILATIKRFCLRTLDTAERQREIIKTSESGH